mmetsp:Transcript_42755/g.141572  ORF Transcript_42755/g.141572 Transcript_42755/m.141572 type:complete len:227 (+) Transcript_42755:250-930(+)
MSSGSSGWCLARAFASIASTCGLRSSPQYEYCPRKSRSTTRRWKRAAAASSSKPHGEKRSSERTSSSTTARRPPEALPSLGRRKRAAASNEVPWGRTRSPSTLPPAAPPPPSLGGRRCSLRASRPRTSPSSASWMGPAAAPSSAPAWFQSSRLKSMSYGASYGIGSGLPGSRQSLRCHQCRSHSAQSLGRTSCHPSAEASASALRSTDRCTYCMATCGAAGSGARA